MRWIITAFFVLAAMSASAEEREQAEGFGAGLQSCAEFAYAYAQSPAKVELIAYSWAQGFMSGLNVMQIALKRPTHDLNAWSITDQQSHIRAYCRENPLAYYSEAVGALYYELPELQPQSN